MTTKFTKSQYELVANTIRTQVINHRAIVGACGERDVETRGRATDAITALHGLTRELAINFSVLNDQFKRPEFLDQCGFPTDLLLQRREREYVPGTAAKVILDSLTTDIERVALRAIVDSEYQSGSSEEYVVGHHVWTAYVNPFKTRRTLSGVFSSLVKKGFIRVSDYDGSPNNAGVVAITKAGWDALQAGAK